MVRIFIFLGILAVIAVGVAINWLLEGPHIRELIAQGIPPRFDDRILIGLVNLEWWAVLFTLVIAGIATLLIEDHFR